MLLTTFIQLQKVICFEHVERRADAMTDLVRNFSLGGDRPQHGHADDPRDLVGLAADMTGLRNGLVGWKKEVERFGERMGGLGGEGREYLARTDGFSDGASFFCFLELVFSLLFSLPLSLLFPSSSFCCSYFLLSGNSLVERWKDAD